MRILIYPHDLAMGGSQLNAIELAAALRDRGHEVIIYGWCGELVDKVLELGLEFIESPRPRFRPTPGIVADLRRLVRERQIDIVHGFEWPPALECRLATLGVAKVVSAATVMSMAVADFIPRTMALTVGTEQIQAERRARGYHHVHLLEPPVDVRANCPDEESRKEFRQSYGIGEATALLVVVGRLVPELKLEGVLAAIDCVAQLATRQPICLAIVGGGQAEDLVRERAEKVNEAHPGTIVLTGELRDPRPAYAAADIALGMGGSALRAMAFAKPLVVQGEQGYWKLLEPQTAAEFYWQGWYGVGKHAEGGASLLKEILQPLLADPARVAELGQFGRELVESRYSLQSLSQQLEETYEHAQQQHDFASRQIAAGLGAIGAFAKYKLGRLRQRLSRKSIADDFNTNTVSSRFGPRAEPQGVTQIVYIAGTYWDDVKGTDHMLATALSGRTEVLWVDPPRTVRSLITSGHSRSLPMLGTHVDLIDSGITRVQTVVPAGVRFAALRNLYERLTVRTVARLTEGSQSDHRLVIHSSATARFPEVITGKKCLYVTDDWVAGEALMGLPAGSVSTRLKQNLAAADEVFAVSPQLAARINDLNPESHATVLPNGCKIAASVVGEHEPAVALVGQLNERLDVELMEEVVNQGLQLRIAGPLKGNDPQWIERMKKLLSAPGVHWAGEIPPTDVPKFLASCRVGLTPYTKSDFNAASFPLKTLDYLAAGLPAVSTDLPSSRWLNCVHLSIGSSNTEVIQLLKDAISRPTKLADMAERRKFARAHSWEQRASEFIELTSLKGAVIT